jgi:hypothetical protein
LRKAEQRLEFWHPGDAGEGRDFERPDSAGVVVAEHVFSGQLGKLSPAIDVPADNRAISVRVRIVEHRRRFGAEDGGRTLTLQRAFGERHRPFSIAPLMVTAFRRQEDLFTPVLTDIAAPQP